MLQDPPASALRVATLLALGGKACALGLSRPDRGSAALQDGFFPPLRSTESRAVLPSGQVRRMPVPEMLEPGETPAILWEWAEERSTLLLVL